MQAGRAIRWAVDNYGRAVTLWTILGPLGGSAVMVAIVKGATNVYWPWLLLLAAGTSLVIVSAIGFWILTKVKERQVAIVQLTGTGFYGPSANQASPAQDFILTASVSNPKTNEHGVQFVNAYLEDCRHGQKVVIKRLDGHVAVPQETWPYGVSPGDSVHVRFNARTESFLDQVGTLTGRLVIQDQLRRRHSGDVVFQEQPRRP